MDEDDARSDTDEEQRQPLLDAEAAVHSSLYTDSHQQQVTRFGCETCCSVFR